MYKLLIASMLLLVPTAALADSSDSAWRRCGIRCDRGGGAGRQVDRVVDVGADDDILMCCDPAPIIGGTPHFLGFPFYATQSILRWRVQPAHNGRSLPQGRWI